LHFYEFILKLKQHYSLSDKQRAWRLYWCTTYFSLRRKEEWRIIQSTRVTRCFVRAKVGSCLEEKSKSREQNLVSLTW
jgi:hypothetical protein